MLSSTQSPPSDTLASCSPSTQSDRIPSGRENGAENCGFEIQSLSLPAATAPVPPRDRPPHRGIAFQYTSLKNPAGPPSLQTGTPRPSHSLGQSPGPCAKTALHTGAGPPAPWAWKSAPFPASMYTPLLPRCCTSALSPARRPTAPPARSFLRIAPCLRQQSSTSHIAGSADGCCMRCAVRILRRLALFPSRAPFAPIPQTAPSC